MKKKLIWWFFYPSPRELDKLSFWRGSWLVYLLYMRIGFTSILFGILYALWSIHHGR